MAQVLAAGLAEVLRDHEDKISAAQAWCEQQNIGSIHELASRADVDEFISAAGLEEFLHQFIVKRRIGDYAAVAPAPPAPPAPKRKKPAAKSAAARKPAAAPIQAAPYESNARSVLGDAHAARCLRLRQTLPRLEMPCVRCGAASSMRSSGPRAGNCNGGRSTTIRGPVFPELRGRPKIRASSTSTRGP